MEVFTPNALRLSSARPCLLLQSVSKLFEVAPRLLFARATAWVPQLAQLSCRYIDILRGERVASRDEPARWSQTGAANWRPEPSRVGDIGS